MNKLLRQKTNKEIMTLNATLGQFDLIDIYRSFYPKTEGDTFFQMHMEHIPGQITYQGTKHVSINSRRLKLCQAYFLTTMA